MLRQQLRVRSGLYIRTRGLSDVKDGNDTVYVGSLVDKDVLVSRLFFSCDV